MSSEMELIQQSLSRSFLKLILPKQLEKEFKQESISTAVKSFKTNVAILTIAFVVILTIALSILDTEILEEWPIACSVIFLCLATVSLLVRISALDKFYQVYTGFLAAIALTASSAIPYFMHGSVMIEITLVASIYCIIIVYTMTKLLFFNAVFWCLCSVVFSIFVLEYFSVTFSWLTFHLHISAGHIFGITLAYIVEYREKQLFLNTRLLNLEKNELNQIKAIAEQRAETQAKISKFLESLSSDQSLLSLGKNIMSEMSSHLSFQVAAIYYIESASLIRFGAYALGAEQSKKESYAFNETLLGASIQRNKTEIVDNFSTEHLDIVSGIGKAKVCYLLTMPILFEGQAIGGLEIGSFKNFSESNLEFLEGVKFGLGVTVNSCKNKIDARK